MQPLYNLKTINLSRSLNLVNTPNFKGMPYLEFLFLEGCIRLYEVDPTIEVLERLTVLNLKDCKNLVHFASSVLGLKYLKVLNLSGCSKLRKLPNDIGHLESLEELHVNGTGIRELPSSIGMLERLPMLKMEDCKDLVCLPCSVGGLKSVKVVNISGCSKLDKLPEELGHIECLVQVDASGTSIQELPCSVGMLEGLLCMSLRDCKHLVCLPSSVGGLKSLKYLYLSGCSELDKLPEELGHVECLVQVDASETSIRELPCSIGMLKELVSMSLRDCKHLVCLPGSVGGLKSLKYLDISGCSKLDKLPEELGDIECLVQVDASGTSIRELPCSIGMLEGLVFMSLRDCKHLVCLPSSVGGLKSLKYLYLSGCSKLEKLPDELGHVDCLEKLDVSGSGIRKLPSSIGLVKNLRVSFAESSKSWNMMFKPFQLLRKRSHIPAGLSVPCLSGLHSLTELNVSECNLSQEVLPSDFGCLSSLRRFDLSRNQFITLPDSIGQLSRLESLQLHWCRNLRTLPQLPSLASVDASHCISLDTLANQIGQCNSVLFGSFVNCFKLVENESTGSIASGTITKVWGIR
ncbi:putative leucine-rich repeat domain, L domain-containing protein [Rosa chinensis]|uniref:Putative leucine-rich repeat domain, L domain-containing protein n=1 Tax=Rosa chinensis TaxID=74649 RepID=A0A2P6PJJ5_ROSCH|nr:putative leucine-rich repeat domain, L domain-containing protein [Rosa chinensis]